MMNLVSNGIIVFASHHISGVDTCRHCFFILILFSILDKEIRSDDLCITKLIEIFRIIFTTPYSLGHSLFMLIEFILC